MKRMRGFCLAMISCSLTGCAAWPPMRCGPGETAALQDTLYFGTGIPQGGVISEQQWSAFVASEVTPGFPSGLTILSADGQWLGDDGQLVREKTYVLQLVHEADAQSDALINEITSAYKQQFQQEAVLRLRTRACMAL